MGIIKWVFTRRKEKRVKALVDVIISRMNLGAKLKKAITSGGKWRTKDIREKAGNLVTFLTDKNVAIEIAILKRVVTDSKGNWDKEVLSKLNPETTLAVAIILTADGIKRGTRTYERRFL